MTIDSRLDVVSYNEGPSHSIPRVSIGSWAFSFGPYADHPWSFEKFTDYAAEHGYDGVEINGFRPHPYDADYTNVEATNLAKSIRERGLSVSGFAPDLRTTPPAEVDANTYLKRIESIAQFCVAAEIDLVRVDTITPPGGPAGDPIRARQRLASTWRRAADRLSVDGIQLVWEFEPGFWLNRPSDVIAMIKTVDNPNFGIIFDTSHAHTVAAYGARQEQPPELLAGGAVEYASLLAPWVRHLHLIDSDGTLHDRDTSVHLPFGEGEVNFPAVLDALGPAAANAAWWTVDCCFWPYTERDAAKAAEIVRDLRDKFLERFDGKESA